MKKRTKCSICTWIIGIFVFVVGIVLVAGFSQIYKNLVKKHMILSSKSKSYEYWQTIKLPVYHEIFFFNVTNPDEIKNGGKPTLQEVGPYVYREHLTKENITWNSNGTVTYNEKHVYVFQQNLTSLHEDDLITTINAPLITLAKMLESKSLPVKIAVDMLLNVFLKNEKLFIEKTAKDLVFDGYPDILVALSPQFPGSNFGWFFPQNNTNDGLYNVETGSKDMSKFLSVNKWQNSDHLNFWSGEECNKIYGSVPELFVPQDNSKKLDLFLTDICRSFSLDYQKDVTVHNTIKSKHYVMNNDTFSNSGKNKCFCNGKCYPHGVLDISTCHGGSPIAMSFPHFYAADPVLLKTIDGLKPEKSKHEFYWDVEPITGLTSEFAARLQINIQLKKLFWLSEFRRVNDIIFPVLWINKIGVMTDYLSNDLLSVTAHPLHTASILGFCAIAIGLCISIATVVVYVIKNRKSDDERLIVDDGSDIE